MRCQPQYFTIIKRKKSDGKINKFIRWFASLLVCLFSACYEACYLTANGCFVCFASSYFFLLSLVSVSSLGVFFLLCFSAFGCMFVYFVLIFFRSRNFHVSVRNFHSHMSCTEKVGCTWKSGKLKTRNM